MISTILRTAAIVCSLLVVASFAIFVRDQLKSGSNTQANLVSGIATKQQAATKPPGQPKRFIDGARHNLVSPFSGIVPSDNKWVNQIVPDLFALLVYGGGLGFLAGYTRGRA